MLAIGLEVAADTVVVVVVVRVAVVVVVVVVVIVVDRVEVIVVVDWRTRLFVFVVVVGAVVFEVVLVVVMAAAIGTSGVKGVFPAGSAAHATVYCPKLPYALYGVSALPPPATLTVYVPAPTVTATRAAHVSLGFVTNTSSPCLSYSDATTSKLLPGVCAAAYPGVTSIVTVHAFVTVNAK